MMTMISLSQLVVKKLSKNIIKMRVVMMMMMIKNLISRSRRKKIGNRKGKIRRRKRKVKRNKAITKMMKSLSSSRRRKGQNF